MNIHLLYRPPMRRWQVRLAVALRDNGHDVRSVAAPHREVLPLGVGTALALQRRVFGPRSSLFDAVPQPDDPVSTPGDLVIALDGAMTDAAYVLEPLFDGESGDTALIAALARGETPRVRVTARRRSHVVTLVSAQLAVEDRDVLSRALDQVLARLVTLLLQAVRRFDQGGVLDETASVAGEAPSSVMGPLASMARGFTRKVAARLPGARLSPNHWRIGYRHVEGAGVATTRCWPPQGFTLLPDDGLRFYADPMPFASDGRTYLFFEDYPYATGKGVIGLVEIAADGTSSSARTVLEQSCHLSYPLILRHGGEIYMLPEMSASGRIQLFRADPFPDRWVPDRVLLDGITAGDATPVFHEGRWWMFATLSDDGGSTWDQLGLFQAPDLLGPWTPHADNPVLVDAGAARPAGPLWHEDGVLMRVAQDCRGGYGRGLAICRVDRLDGEHYAQTVVMRLDPPSGLGADGVHTLARTEALEVIDLRYPRRSAVRRGPARD